MSERLSVPNYYMPYDSGDEYETDGNETGTDGGKTGTDDERTDDEEDYDDSGLPDYEDARIRREQDPRYALIRTAGPNFNTSQQQLKYMEGAPGAEYNTSTNITTLQNLVYLNPPKTTLTSLFSVKAINRDRRVYPSPFNYEIKLPRVYKNVTKFQLVQLSFPNNTVNAIITSSTFVTTLIDILLAKGVDPICISTCVTLANAQPFTNAFGIMEQGKLDTNGKQVTSVISIPDGIYTNEDLVTELNTASNNTPPFNLISYNDFKTYFQTTGDISILFNEPGDLFYSHVNHTKHRVFSKETIANTYYTQIHIDSFPIITDKIAFNAYYYPILKELLATNKGRPFLSGTYTYSQIRNLVLGQFQGLDSDAYYTICSTNRGTLDAYRKTLTFEYSHVNRYEWLYNSNTRQFRCIHNALHTSIQRDITNKYNTYLNHQLTLSSLTPNSFKTLKTYQATTKTIFKDMEAYLSTVLGQYHFVNGYTYNGGDSHVTNESTFTAAGLHSDPLFTTMFNFSSIFGNQLGTYAGTHLNFTNFLDYHSTISSYHNIFNGATSTISSIYSKTTNTHHQYISSKYSSVLPSSYIQNKSYITFNSLPVSFVGNKYVYSSGTSCESNTCTRECCAAIEQLVAGWYSCIPVTSVINSIGYRLGLINFDINSFSIASTILALQSTNNTNYLLQINNEQSFNNMDMGMPENHDTTNITTGQVKLMYAKILTGGLGSGEIAQTVIQNPILFETPLGKLDKLQFKIYYDDNQLTPGWVVIPFDIGFADWDATFQIDEEVGYADRNSGWGNNPTVPIPNNPAALQYLALTSPNNPNNK